MPCCRGARLALDVARGVAFLHQLTIVHMDIKPGVSPRSSLQVSGQMQLQLQRHGCYMVEGCHCLLFYPPLLLATHIYTGCLQNVLLTRGDAGRGDGGGVHAKLADCDTKSNRVSRFAGLEGDLGWVGGWGGWGGWVGGATMPACRGVVCLQGWATAAPSNPPTSSVPLWQTAADSIMLLPCVYPHWCSRRDAHVCRAGATDQRRVQLGSR